MNYDECAICNKKIVYMEGAQFWMHLGPKGYEVLHLGRPQRLTDLKNHPTVLRKFERGRNED